MKLSMENQISDMKVSMEASLEGKIAKALETNTMTYASAASTGVKDTSSPQGNALHLAIEIEAKNAEMVFQYESQGTENNIIIHGVKEITESAKENKKLDDTYITASFQTLGADVKPKTIFQLGKFDNNGKIRPLKLVMSTIDDKDLIISRLPNLKTAEDQYKKISVKDDYTPDERAMIRNMNEKAGELNKVENTTEWKIRGTPKTGLRLVKIKAKQAIPQGTPSAIVQTN